MDKEKKMKGKWGRDQGRGKGKGAKDQAKRQETRGTARETVVTHGEKRKLAPVRSVAEITS